MRIVDIRETAIPLKSRLAQFELRFLRDDDVGGRGHHRRDARRQAGCRLRLQFDRPLRLRRADARALHSAHPDAPIPTSLLDDAGDNLDPEKILAVHDAATRKSGGHSERSIAHRHHRGRGLGRRRQDRRQAAASRAGRALQRRQGAATRCSAMSAAAGTAPGKTIKDLQDEMRRHLDAGYTMVKMKVGGMPLAEDLRRVEAVRSDPRPPRASSRSTPTRKFDRDEALAYAQGADAVQAALVRGAVRSARLRAAGGDCRRL